MQIKKVYFLFLLAFCLAISTFAQAAKVEQLLLVMPEVTDQAPSAEFYTIIHSAIDYLGKAHTPSRFYIISKDVLTGDYAKIVLHSYGLKNGQIKILPDIGSLKLIDLQDLKVFGGISLNSSRLMSPEFSNSFNCSVSIFLEIVGINNANFPNRNLPAIRQ